jgi:hypothetical protein
MVCSARQDAVGWEINKAVGKFDDFFFKSARSRFHNFSSQSLVLDEMISSPLLIVIVVAVRVTVHCRFGRLDRPARLLDKFDSLNTYAVKMISPDFVGIVIVPCSTDVII